MNYTKKTNHIIILFTVLIYNSIIISQKVPDYNSTWVNLSCPIGTVSSIYYDRPNDAVYAAGLGGVYRLNSLTLQWNL